MPFDRLTRWIRKRLGKSSLATQENLEAQRHAQEFDRKSKEALKQPYSNPEGNTVTRGIKWPDW